MLRRDFAVDIHEINVSAVVGRVTIRNGPHRLGADKPKMSARKVADF